MRKLYTLGALAFLGFASQSAFAQSAEFRGFRAEAQIGDDRFHSQGTHDDKLSWGIAGGFDGVINEKIVIGPEFSYWHGRAQNVTTGTGGAGLVYHKGFQELGAGVRAGYLINPKLLVYGIGGYVNAEQRKAFTGIGATGVGRFYDNYSADGYQVGGGAEYSLAKNFYVSAGYRYANYHGHTSRERAFVGAGVRF